MSKISQSTILVDYDIFNGVYVVSVKNSPIKISGKGETISEASRKLKDTYSMLLDSLFPDTLLVNSNYDIRDINRFRKIAINIKHGNIRVTMSRTLSRNIHELTKLTVKTNLKD